MSTKFRKFVSVLLACVMVFSLCGLTAFAEDNTQSTATENANVSEAPATADPTAAVTEAPKSEETPAPVEASPKSDETPANVTESPKAEESPKTSASPAESESPKAEESPAVSESPAATAAPTEVAPSVRITGSETAGGVTVNVDAPEGAFPAGTTLKITPISGIKNFLGIPMNKIENSVEDGLDDSGDLTGAVAFDITFTDQNGNEIQPDAAYPVSVTFTVEDAADALGDPDQLQAFHMENTSDKNPQAVSAPVDVKPDAQNEVKVDATQFSIYVIAGKNARPTQTYIFMVDSKEYATQIIKNGEKLNRPATPTKAGQAFAGWYNGKTAFTDFDKEMTVDDKSDKTVTLTASFAEPYYVTFMENRNADARVIATKTYAKGDTIDSSDVVLALPATQHLSGWVNKAGNEVKTVSADVTLYPVIETGNWLTFNSDGGTIIDPVFYQTDAKVSAPKAPTKAGYTFDHWKKADGSTYTFGSTLSGPLTLTAVWTAAQASYKVVYWQQNAEDDLYSYKEYQAKSGTAGTDAAYNTKSYDGFHFSKADAKKIAGDGSTIVNVYYDRNTYTLTFLDVSQTTCGLEEHTHNLFCYVLFFLVCGKTEHTHTDSCYKVVATTTLKYGQSTKTFWDATNVANPGYQWFVDEKSAKNYPSSYTGYTEAPSMGNGNLTVYGKKCANGTSTIYYFENGTSTQIHPALQLNDSGYNLTDEDHIPIAGFKYSHDKKVSNQRYEIYYDRLSYQITFNTNDGKSTVKQTGSIKYQASIASQAPADYETGKTTKVVSGQTYYFAGWYDNEACAGTPFSFTGATMPAKDLILYGKWATQMFTITFNPNGGTLEGTEPSISVAYGDQIAEPRVTNGTDKLLGWYNGDKQFSFSTQITSNLTLVARWSNASQYTVVYNANGGTGSVSDTAKYAEGAAAKVLPGSGLTAPDGKVFIGWTDKTGKLYYPGQSIEICASLIESSTITLTAKWAAPKETTTVTYKAGDGATGDDYQLIYAINEGFALYNNQNPDHLFTKAGYAFNGWSDGTNTYTLADISSNTYGADNQQTVPNVLTAQWRKLAVISYDANGGSGTMAPQTVAEDNTIAVSGNSFTSSDSTFTGWNTRADGKGTSYAPGAILTATADVILFAQWHKIVTYTITYHSNYDPDTTTTDPVSENTTATIKAALTRAAYTFTGWNTQADGKGTAYAPGATFTPTADLPLYAQWSAIDKLGFYIRNDGKVQPEGALYNSSNYTTVVNKDTQTFDYTKAGVSFSTGSNPSLFVISDSTVRSALTAAGNAIPTAEAVFNACKTSPATFDGGTIDYANLTAAEFARDYEIQWYVLKCQVNDSWHVDGVIVRKPTYNVTYSWTNNPTGTTLPTDSNAYHTGDAVPVDNTYQQGYSVTINHVIYTFSGWTPTGLTDGKVGASNVTMSGSWSTFNEASYKVTYDLNGGSSSAQLIYDGLYSGDSTPKIADPAKADTAEYAYTFAGWSPVVSDTVSGNATYVAQWTSTKRSYDLTVEYVDEKGENIVPVSTTSYAYGTPYSTSPLTPAQLTGAYADYKLSSQPGNSVGTITGPTTVVYTYIPKNSYSVTVNYLDKATGEAIPNVNANVTSYLEGASYDVTTAANLDITGYTRAEGNDESNYTGTISNSSVVIDVYYNINTYTVTYEFRGSVPTDAQLPTTDETYDYGAPFTAVQPNVVTGYTFDGWYLEKNANLFMKVLSSLANLFGMDDSEEDKYTSGTITNNITLYGTWTANTHNVKYMLDGTEYAVGDYAGDKTFGTEQTVAPKAEKPGYTVSDWTANGATVIEGKYSMPDNDVVFTATSGINTYTVTTKITNGTITPTATVNYDGTVNVTYSANSGYYISGINVDGSSVSTSTYANGYTFSNVKANHSIEVVCTAYGGGYVEPSTSPTSIPDSEPPKDDKPSTSPSAPASSDTTIPDDDVPQGDQPSANIPDDDTPTADAPVTIPDGSTPTAAKPTTPKTGDNSNATLFSILAAVSAAGLAAIGITGKKRKQNEGK